MATEILTGLTGFLTLLGENIYNIIGAIIILIIGWIIGRAIGWVIKKVLVRYKIDQRFIKKPIVKFSELFPTLFSWAVYLYFIWLAISFLAIEALIVPVGMVFTFLPTLIGAIIIIIMAYGIGEYVRQQIEKSKVAFSEIIGKGLFFMVIYVGLTLALPLIGINVALLNNLLLIVVGAAGVGLAIALGWGLKDVVAAWAKKYQRKAGK
jgi:hypothetical protein